MCRSSAPACSIAVREELAAAWLAWRKLVQSPQQQACVVANIVLSLNWALTTVVMPLQATVLGASPTVVGLMCSAGAVASAGMSPLAGVFSDHFGRTEVAIPSMCCLAVGCAGLAASDSLVSMSAAFLFWSAA